MGIIVRPPSLGCFLNSCTTLRGDAPSINVLGAYSGLADIVVNIAIIIIVICISLLFALLSLLFDFFFQDISSDRVKHVRLCLCQSSVLRSRMWDSMAACDPASRSSSAVM